MKPPRQSIVPSVEKKCTKCRKMFPGTKEYFDLNNQKRSGLTPACKTCNRKANKASREKWGAEEKKYKASLPVREKKCTKCKDVLPIHLFGVKKANKSGWTAACKACNVKSSTLSRARLKEGERQDQGRLHGPEAQTLLERRAILKFCTDNCVDMKGGIKQHVAGCGMLDLMRQAKSSKTSRKSGNLSFDGRKVDN